MQSSYVTTTLLDVDQQARYIFDIIIIVLYFLHRLWE